MKNVLIKLCWPILHFFETNEIPSNYKSSHRVALNVLGGLFLLLAFISSWAAKHSDELASLLPMVIFFGVGLVAIVVGSLGSNGAVSKIWGTK